MFRNEWVKTSVGLVLLLALGCGRSNLDPEAGAGAGQPPRIQLLGIGFSPAAVTVRVGGSAGLRLIGRTADGPVELDEDPEVTFAVPQHASYAAGVVRGLAEGDGAIVARRGGLRAEARVLVEKEHRIRELRVEPAVLRVRTGGARSLSVIAVRFDGTEDEVSDLPGTTLRVEGDPVAALEGATLRGLTPGEALLVAERRDASAEARIVVTRDLAGVVGLEVAPAQVELALDQALQLRVTGHYADGGTEDVSAETLGTRYVLSDPAVLLPAGNGLFFADGPGETRVRVELGAASATAVVRVRAGGPRLLGIEVAPAAIRGPLGYGVSLRVSGLRDDGSSVDLSSPGSGTRYASSAPAIAPVDGAGIVWLRSLGLAAVTVTHGRYEALVPVEVVLPPIVDFELVPDFDIVTAGESAVIRAVATAGDGRRIDVSCHSAYASTNPAVVAPGECGTLTGLVPGDEVVTATAPDGVRTAAARVSVRNRTLLHFSHTGSVETRVGDSFTLFYAAAYSDGSVEELTFDPELRVVAPDPAVLAGRFPTFTALREGTVVLAASYRGEPLDTRVWIAAARPDVHVRAGELLELEVPEEELGSLVVEAGGTLRFVGTREIWISAQSIRVDGGIELIATPGVDGFTVAAPGGTGAPGAGGGGAGADGDTTIPATGGGGAEHGGPAAPAAGAGTAAGYGGGDNGGGAGAAGCAQAGGGAGNGGPGGAGGGDAGPGTGGAGGPARQGWGGRGGGGGGGGSTCGNNSGGGGGGGGGRLYLGAGSIEVTGTIFADGASGGAGYVGSAGGGGGAGGTIELAAYATLHVSGTLSVRGGRGGDSTDGDAGGGGGGGQILLSGGPDRDVGSARFQVTGGAAGAATAGGSAGLPGGDGLVFPQGG